MCAAGMDGERPWGWCSRLALAQTHLLGSITVNGPGLSPSWPGSDVQEAMCHDPEVADWSLE